MSALQGTSITLGPRNLYIPPSEMREGEREREREGERGGGREGGREPRVCSFIS